MTTAILFLFFLQLLTDLIEATYAFGLLQTSIPVEVASVLFLFTPVLFLISPWRPGRRFLLVSGWLVLLCRAVSVLLDTRGRMVLSGLGVGAFLLFLPGLIWYASRKERRAAGSEAVLGISLGVLASIFLRSLYSGNDISAYGPYRLIAWALALAGAILLPRMLQSISARKESDEAESDKSPFGRLASLCLAAASGFVLLYFGFTSPSVISRWTGANYVLVTGLAAFSAAVFITLWTASDRFRKALTRGVLLGWNAVFIICLALTLWLNQVSFPDVSSAYPVLEQPAGVFSFIAMVLMLLLFPVIFFDLGLLFHEMVDHRPTLRQLGGASFLAAFYLLLIILAQVFTTVYDYIPVVGPMLRDRFWLVFTAAAIILILPLVFSARKVTIEGFEGGKSRKLMAGGAFLTAAVTLIASVLMSAHPGPAPELSSLRVLTYNIQQGYSQEGAKNFSGQLDLIRNENPDIIGLQETDTARAAGGNSDVVRYVADRLDMYSYYGPKTVTGTFGIALLSRYPIQNPRTFFMYSQGEQTAAIEADITAGTRTFHVLVTHLGNGGPLIQQEQVLQMLEGRENIIAMGDFNFRPDTEQYTITTAQLEDAWLTAASLNTVPAGLDSSRRIDHIFVSPGMHVNAAEYLGPGPSDHPAMMAEIGW